MFSTINPSFLSKISSSLRYTSIMQTSITKFLKRRSDNDNAGDSKRVALSRSDSIPVEDGTKKSSQSDESPSTIAKSSTLDNTPLKAQVPCLTPKPSPVLLDVNTIIQKKISSGSYALHDNIGHSWFKSLQSEFDKPYFKKLSQFVQAERKTNVVYPPENKVYSWTHHHDIKDTRVIIIGQDPYHGPGQAHGLSFSVQKGVRIPPSLVNIFKELEDDIADFKAPTYGDLIGWARQGVLMLNTCLTVTQGKAYSHQNKGWETFTDAVITWISKNLKHKAVFLLWGRPAQRKSALIDKRHKILTAAHPSPLSAHNGFFGCRHFSQTNTFLISQKLSPIDWKAL